MSRQTSGEEHQRLASRDGIEWFENPTAFGKTDDGEMFSTSNHEVKTSSAVRMIAKECGGNSHLTPAHGTVVSRIVASGLHCAALEPLNKTKQRIKVARVINIGNKGASSDIKASAISEAFSKFAYSYS
jgi:hypothetical protein